MKLKKIFAHSVIIIVSTLTGLLLCEVLARFVLNPADYLSVSLIRHDRLGSVVAPQAAGFDEWGYRNRAVPVNVDIVAIGDSHTYGNTAKMDESWPYVVGRLTGKSVYNMGLGGYGPNQYSYLLNSRALGLNPGIVLCGLYMGDDFENAFTMTYGLDYWSFLRQLSIEGIDADIWREPDDVKHLKYVRTWLSRNSLIYQIVFHGPLMGRIKGYLQVLDVSRGNDQRTTSLIVEDENIHEVFRPMGIAARLDLGKMEIREGIRIAQKLLLDMNEECRKNGSRFVVVVIPTKEMVFADYLERNPSIRLNEAVQMLLTNERKARQGLFEYFRAANIHYVDALPAMKRAVGRELYARSDRDMHPGRNGYQVIAESVVESLTQSDLLERQDPGRESSRERRPAGDPKHGKKVPPPAGDR
jgi:hypothetical protein